MHVRVCPECGEEFRPDIVRCSDCGAMLEDRHEVEEATGSGEAGPAPVVGPGETEGRYVSIFRADRAADLEPLAVRLGQAGIPFRVRTAQQTFVLLTREEDGEQVRGAAGDLLAGSASADAVDEPTFDPEAGYAACPACGHRLAPRIEECPECGLAVGPVEDAGPAAQCPRCGGPPDAFGRCASCGPLDDQQ